MTRLHVHGCGAVTPVGLAFASTCAAIRAGIARFEDDVPLIPPGDPGVKGARVKASGSLRKAARDWLVQLGGKALRECWESAGEPAEPVPVFVCTPESYRNHPGRAQLGPGDFMSLLEREARVRVDPASRELDTGRAGFVQGLQMAARWLQIRPSSSCMVGGVDTLLNDVDIGRLRGHGRLQEAGNPQGCLPAEGAAFVSVSLDPRTGVYAPLAELVGLGLGTERSHVTGDRYSLGEGLAAAVQAAIADTGRLRESDVSFVVSDGNGERYAAWETSFAHSRIYQTRREHLPVHYPAGSIGDLGVAAGAMNVIVATVAIARGYSAGPVGVCEMVSDSGLRGACFVAFSSNAPAFSEPWERRRNARARR